MIRAMRMPGFRMGGLTHFFDNELGGSAHGMEKGFVPYEKTLLVMVWTAPIIARPIAFFAFLPFGVLVMLAMFYVILSRAAAETGATRLISGQVAAA